MRLFERACRRAALPLRMSEGFNPRPRFSFPLSLAVGVEGREEVMEVQLTDWLAPADVHRRLGEALPTGLELVEVKAVDPRRVAEVTAAVYRIEDDRIGQLSAGDLEAVLARTTLPVSRTRKHLSATRASGPPSGARPPQDAARVGGRSVAVDIRPYLRALTLLPEAGGPPALRAVLGVTPGGTARPEEILQALGIADPLQAGPRIVRERVILAEEGDAPPGRSGSRGAAARRGRQGFPGLRRHGGRRS